MKPETALHLFQQINKGPAIGADSDGNIVYSDTLLSVSMGAIGAPSYIGYIQNDPAWKTNGRPFAKVYNVLEQVAFLQDWADALEKCGPIITPAGIPPILDQF